MKMKQLKSTAHDLQAIVERSLVARDLAEPLASFDVEQTTDKVASFMDREVYDVVGIREDGLIIGYLRRSELREGKIANYLRLFEDNLVMEETRGIADVLRRFDREESSPVFVTGASSHVWGIITRGDLQKAPVRMYLFALITLLEMQLLNLIRHQHSADESWKQQLSADRLKKAIEMYEHKCKRNIAIDVLDCLQWCDKRDIVVASDSLWSSLGWESPNKAKSELNELQGLRDDLAHAQDILVEHWPRLVKLADSAQKRLKACERLELTREVAA